MLGTKPNGETKIIQDGSFVLNNSSKCSKSQDKSSKLESQSIVSIPNNIGELTSVAQLNPGTTTLLFLNLSVCNNAANAKRIAEDPELTYTEYFVPILFAHLDSNSQVKSPFVSLGISS